MQAALGWLREQTTVGQWLQEYRAVNQFFLQQLAYVAAKLDADEPAWLKRVAVADRRAVKALSRKMA